MKIFGLFGKAANMLSNGKAAEGALVNRRHPNDVALQPYYPYGPVNYGTPKKSKTDLALGAMGLGAAAIPLVGGVTQLLAQRDAGKAINESEADLPNRIVLHADTVSNTPGSLVIIQNLIYQLIHILHTPISERNRDRRDVEIDGDTVSDS